MFCWRGVVCFFVGSKSSIGRGLMVVGEMGEGFGFLVRV